MNTINNIFLVLAYYFWRVLGVVNYFGRRIFARFIIKNNARDKAVKNC